MTLYRTVADSLVGITLAVAAVGFAHRRGLDAPTRWLLAWATVDAIASVAGMYTRIVLQNTQHVAQIWYPVSAGLALAATASTFGDSRARRSLFTAATIVAALIVTLTILVEQFGYFSRYTGALHGMALTLGGAIMVMRRALNGRGEMLHDPVFLIGAGFLIIGAPSAFLAISRWHFPFDGQTRSLAYTIKNILSIGAYACMVGAFHYTQRRTALRKSSAVR
ncbi:MAG: hypothetical protein SFU84_11150 [Gemmatimonadales bacterium]|nr:hypothetical protein [Gemmatimonadales bacterium]